MRISAQIIITVGLLLAISSGFSQQNLYTQTSLVKPTRLHQGYDTDDDLARQNCLHHNDYTLEGSRVVDANLRNTNIKEAALQLNINTGIGPSAAAFSNQPVRKFVAWFDNDATHQTFLYRTNIVLPSKRYQAGENSELNARGTLLITQPQAYRDVCGDQYTSQLYYQGSLYVGLQLHFFDAADKIKFTLNSTVSAADLVDQLPTALQALDRRDEIELRVFQLGGDAASLEKVFTDFRCTISNASQCLTQFGNLIKYNTDFLAQLPSTTNRPIPANAAVNALIAQSYSSLNIPYTPVADQLTPQMKGIRNQVYMKLLPLYAAENRADYILRLTNLNPAYQQQVQQLRHNIQFNLGVYKTSGQACFRHLAHCITVYNAVVANLKPMDLTLLNEPIVS